MQNSERKRLVQGAVTANKYDPYRENGLPRTQLADATSLRLLFIRRGRDMHMDIIAKLNKLRLERNMSVYRLAELSGLSQSTLANTFSRGTIPSLRNLEALCDTLGVTLAQFFTEDETLVRLTPEEADFFAAYKKLPPAVKRSVNEIVTSVANTAND